MISSGLLWLSGVDHAVLERTASESERNKFVGMGGAILTTGVLSMLAVTLTLYSFLSVTLPMALAAGLAWAVILINLDRLLMSTLTRQKRWWANALVCVPRLGLTVIVGLVFAEPLLLAFFDREVSAEAVKGKQVRMAERKAELDQEFGEIQVLRERQAALEAELAASAPGASVEQNPRIARLRAELADLRAQLSAAQDAVNCEREGRCGSGRAGEGPAYGEKVVLRDRLRQQVDEKGAELSRLERHLLAEEAAVTDSRRASRAAELSRISNDLRSLEVDRQQSEQQFRLANDAPLGFLDRKEALARLADERAALRHWVSVLRAFIVVLDCLPLLVKTISLSSASHYDELVKADAQDLTKRREIELAADRRAAAIEAESRVEEARLRQALRRQTMPAVQRALVEKETETAMRVVKTLGEIGDRQVDRQLEAFETDLSTAPPVYVMAPAPPVERSVSQGLPLVQRAWRRVRPSLRPSR